ncbi:flagellar basal-body rod protein FlgG [Rhizobium sp. LEGMi198b]|uniref:flagellar basal-body rod protein FlgG n=1 Tax=unclassified Rhizobium TaxID=2613769 RepID=UPI000CDF4F2D|nr:MULTISPECIES: flagellar basal-body rod protein FlgG [Rhizobium]AVA20323.1 flagellar basal body rod protein FlgG [Rhizobium sp. NXC24]MDK4740556.1 flagellar basal-body rod protein FlgG [Rhizobium sp. CNPSo 3464]UWU21614.1 flagellar basal-body rod protein FlgG [Rhizobium tropici]WFU02432.1 flagellar basal-body rod protein FlgG [Rhizobium sp. CB3171]
MRALAIAATGMDAQQTNLEVIANNIANINTTGYKRSRAEFSDLLYQTERAKGISNRPNQAVVPEGANIGLGVQTTAVRNIQIQGELSQTQNDLDVALVGRGWFQIQMPDGTTAYTRAGSFNKSDTGQMVTADGNVLEPGITIPNNASNIVINESGQVSATIGTATTPTVLGQLQIANFVNEAGLQPMGSNLFTQTPASGDPVVSDPNTNGFAYMKQGYLESSNVDAVKEITDLISAQRAYEMNSKVITTADDMAQIVSKDLK